jgi:hypothetical protein
VPCYALWMFLRNEPGHVRVLSHESCAPNFIACGLLLVSHRVHAEFRHLSHTTSVHLQKTQQQAPTLTQLEGPGSLHAPQLVIWHLYERTGLVSGSNWHIGVCFPHICSGFRPFAVRAPSRVGQSDRGGCRCMKKKAQDDLSTQIEGY